MGFFFFLLLVLLFVAVGVFVLYILIDFFEYIKKYHPQKWKEVSFEKPFGIQQEDFFIYPIKPGVFIPFLFSEDNIDDANVTEYKTKIKWSMLVLLIMFATSSLVFMI